MKILYHTPYMLPSFNWRRDTAMARDREDAEKAVLILFCRRPKPNQKDHIRSQIIHQCIASRPTCKLLDCNSPDKKCDNPVEVMKVFQESVFGLQPTGDSPTRRATFDSILTRCIPVFFHPGSAYTQYLWHLRKNYAKYSMFIPMNLVKEGKVNISEALLQASKDKASALREELTKLIRKVIYADPRSQLENLEDAVDIAVKGVPARAEKARRTIKEGNDPSISFARWNASKHNLSEVKKEHGTEASGNWGGAERHNAEQRELNQNYYT